MVDTENEQQTVYREQCVKCKGAGTFGMYGDRQCFRCAGRGYNEYKTSPEQRAARKAPTPESRAVYRDKQQLAADRKWEAWAANEPGRAQWIDAAIARGFDFAASMRTAIGKYGHLTPGQQAAVDRCIEGEKARAERIDAEKAREVLVAVQVDTTVAMPGLEDAFARAKAQGLQHPTIRANGFTISPAPEGGKNVGAIYVRGSEHQGAYLGKVVGGRFVPSRECPDDKRDAVLELMKDPLAAAVAYGKQFNKCAICGRDLSDPDSVERGIGPICASRMGWA
jgi:hypothetical protein